MMLNKEANRLSSHFAYLKINNCEGKKRKNLLYRNKQMNDYTLFIYEQIQKSMTSE